MDINVITDKLKNLPTRNKPYVFFMHIPKTGGTSLISSLKKKYPFNFFKVNAVSSLKAAKKLYGKNYLDYQQCYQLRECILAYALETRVKCIAGHIPFSPHLFEGNKYLLITILRDPVQRFISKYLYNFYKPGDHNKLEISLPEFLDSGLGRASGREYLRYFCGSYENEEHSHLDLLEQSKENILKFDVIGFLEDMNRFGSDFYQKTDIKLNIPHKNQTRDLTAEKTFSPKTIEKIEELCKYDIEIYKFAKKQFS